MIECDAAANVLVAADEAVALLVPVVTGTALPNGVVPSMNCTGPVGFPPVTAALRVRNWPTFAGLAVDVTVVAVALRETTSLTTAEVLAAFAASPG